MTPELVNAWLLVAALALAVLIGALMSGASARTVFHNRETLWATVAFGAVGASLLLAPKWTQLVVKYDKFEARLAQLEQFNRSQSVLIAKLAAVNSDLSRKVATTTRAVQDTIPVVQSIVPTVAASAGPTNSAAYAKQSLELENALRAIMSPDASASMPTHAEITGESLPPTIALEQAGQTIRALRLQSPAAAAASR
jgi:hypothetical protein